MKIGDKLYPHSDITWNGSHYFVWVVSNNPVVWRVETWDDKYLSDFNTLDEVAMFRAKLEAEGYTMKDYPEPTIADQAENEYRLRRNGN